jgi:hypothetical protein
MERKVTDPFADNLDQPAWPYTTVSPPPEIQRWEDDGGGILADLPQSIRSGRSWGTGDWHRAAA